MHHYTYIHTIKLHLSKYLFYVAKNHEKFFIKIFKETVLCTLIPTYKIRLPLPGAFVFGEFGL